MTPEEAAARIIAGRQNNQDGQPRFWRDALYRVEQSIALFLASLIPGVGERHVRAREEQRREEERRRAEAAAAAENQNVSQEEPKANEPGRQPAVEISEVNVGGPAEQSTSSSVEARQEADAGELRNRI
jgi:hemolysin activation/secretion protein